MTDNNDAVIVFNDRDAVDAALLAAQAISVLNERLADTEFTDKPAGLVTIIDELATAVSGLRTTCMLMRYRVQQWYENDRLRLYDVARHRDLADAVESFDRACRMAESHSVRQLTAVLDWAQSALGDLRPSDDKAAR
jgi:phage host-nuclease inhibitor protein Gam